VQERKGILGRPPPPAPPAEFRAAFDAFRAGRFEQAERLCRAMLPTWPREAAVRRLLAMACQAGGNAKEARREFAAATELAPKDADAWADFGQCLLQGGEIDAAMASLRRALDLMPQHVVARHSLGLALASRGDLAEAEVSFRQAVDAEPGLGGAWHHLAQIVFETDPAAAEKLMDRAVRLMPGYGPSGMHHAALLTELGRVDEARRVSAATLARDPRQAGTVESHAYLREKAADAPRFGSRFSLLDHALAQAPAGGAFLEFGVRWGVSARYLAHRVDHLHGFDSLQGLPEEWVAGEGAGAYSTAGTTPPLPANVTLHPGWFEETLPRFLGEVTGPVSFIHVDCDIYSSTRTVLEGLAGRLLPGAVIVFDEYHSYPGWRDHEYRAFQEFVADRPVTYRYLGWTLFGRQAAVRLDG